MSGSSDPATDTLVEGVGERTPTAACFAPQPERRVLLLPGTRIGRYTLLDKLAQGAFGVVFAARDRELDRVVALKILHPAHVHKHTITRRFVQEAVAAARVVHPGVVTILDCGHYPGGAYIAMDLLDGESLTDRLATCGRLLPHDAVEVASQIAAALEAAHAAGVLHRDLKPDNIFLVRDPAMPGNLRVKVLDFGLAKVVGEAGAPGATRVHSVFGTPRYMSPEQCRSSTRIDHRADIYSLGCILFELVTGVPPFDGDSDEVIEAHLTRPTPRASMHVTCPPALDDLIAQLMSKRPAQRPPSMTQVRRALDELPLGRLGSGPYISPCPPLPPYFPKRPTITSSPFGPTPFGGLPVVTPSASTALQMAIAVPVALPAPTERIDRDEHESVLPLVLVVIACAIAGALAALLVV